MGKASLRKRLRREQYEALQGMRERTESNPLTRNARWAPPSGGPKISAALSELIEPFLGRQCSLENYRAWALIGAAVWNWTVEPDSFPWEKLQVALQQAGHEKNAAMDAVFENLKRRKLELFPDDRWLIVETKVIRQSDGSLYLTAAAVAREGESWE